MCDSCRRKGRKVGDCDGCFSVSDFDALQDQREKMQQDIVEKDRRIGELIAALTSAQREKDNLQKAAERLLEEQKRMLSREMSALDAIDEAFSLDVSSGRFAFSLDPAFKPALAQMVDFFDSIIG